MHDLILKGGLVVDGTRKAPYIANVCVKGGKIACITAEDAEAKEVLDVTGLAVAPGFIDPHSHSDDFHMRGYPVESQLAQGVTTEIMGNCGTCVMPALEDSFEDVDSWLKVQGKLGTFLILALIPAWALCIGGYYLYEALITGNFVAPTAGIPGYIMQSVLSTVLYVIAGIAMDKLDIKTKLNGGSVL